MLNSTVNTNNFGINESSLVVNADDFGMVQSATDGVLRGHREGIISSASIVTTTDGFAYATERLNDYPKLGVGLHFTLSVGRSLSGKNTSSILTDSKGYLKWHFIPLLMALSRPLAAELRLEIESELDAQINKALDAGIALDHINGERHIHLIPGVSDLVHAAARRYSIPYVRHMTNDVGFRYTRTTDIPRFIANGGLLKFVLLRYLSKKALKTAQMHDDALTASYCTMLYTGKMHRVLPRIWANPPEGVTEIAVHPGDLREALQPDVSDVALQNYLRHSDRQRELMACIDLKSVATRANLVSFRDLALNRQIKRVD